MNNIDVGSEHCECENSFIQAITLFTLLLDWFSLTFEWRVYFDIRHLEMT